MSIYKRLKGRDIPVNTSKETISIHNEEHSYSDRSTIRFTGITVVDHPELNEVEVKLTTDDMKKLINELVMSVDSLGVGKPDDRTIKVDSDGVISLKGSKVTYGTAAPNVDNMIEGEVYFRIN